MTEKNKKLVRDLIFLEFQFDKILKNLFFWEIRKSDNKKSSSIFEQTINNHNFNLKLFWNEKEKKEGLEKLKKNVGFKEFENYLNRKIEEAKFLKIPDEKKYYQIQKNKLTKINEKYENLKKQLKRDPKTGYLL